MNIAWIEDDLRSMEAGAKILIELLDEKNGTNLMDQFDDPHKEFTRERLDVFFEETLCKLSWFDTYQSMQVDINKLCYEKWDIVIIDLNLENGFFDEKGKIDPEQAGFALYMQRMALNGQNGAYCLCVCFWLWA